VQIEFSRIAADDIGDNAASGSARFQPDMAMPIRVNYLGAGRCGADAGHPSGVAGRWPIQYLTRSLGNSRGRPGNIFNPKSRKISARFQFGAADSPAISTCPASRRPCAVRTFDIFPSLGKIGMRGATSGAAITA
jgi:hypothetical protein